MGESRKHNAILCLLLAAATLALYNPVARHPFVNFDDDRYVTDNSHVNQGLSWQTVKWSVTTFHEAMWQPLTWLSHAADCQFFRLNPAGHHYTSLLIHVLNAVLLFLVLQAATGYTWRSLMVAFLFALHPLNVEAVAWIAERKTVLSMFFLLLALGAYGFYARKPGAGRYTLVALLFACALMSKPMAVTFPAVLLLWDYWPLNRVASPHQDAASQNFSVVPLSRLILEKLPLVVLSLASAMMTVKSAKAGSSLGSARDYPFLLRLENAIVSYAKYVGKAFWPSRLAPMYPHPDFLPLWQVAIAATFLMAVTVLVLLARRRRYLAVGWFWFLGTLVPMIGLVQVGAVGMADRYAYLSFLGLFMMICWGAADWAKERGVSSLWLGAPAVAVLAALAAVTHHQLNYWEDNLTLWSHTLQVTTDNFVADDNYGGALIAAGRTEESMPYFRRAAAISPLDGQANLNLAVYAQAHGSLQEAIQRYDIVVHTTNDGKTQSTAYSNMGFAFRAMADYGRAQASFLAAIQANPENVKPLYGLALLLQKTGELTRAASYYARAVALQPTDFGYLLLAQALEKSGHVAEAQAAYEKAQQLSQDLPQAQRAAQSLLAR